MVPRQLSRLLCNPSEMENLNLKSSFSMDGWDEFEEKIEELNSILNNDTVSVSNSQFNDNPTTFNRSCFNTASDGKSKETIDYLTSESLSPNVFMKMVEEDANRRSIERTERNYQANKLKNAGNQEFKKGNLEKALSAYNKALDLRRDSYVLYINRALTFLSLGLFTKCLQDCQSALKLKDTLKGRLLKAKAFYKIGDKVNSESMLEETREIYKNDTDIINDYTEEWKS